MSAERGNKKTEMATSPTCGQSGYITPAVSGVPNAQRGDKKPWMPTWPTCGPSGYITPAVSEVPNARGRDKSAKWLLAPHMGKVATSPLPSWGSPMLSAETKNRNGYVAHL